MTLHKLISRRRKSKMNVTINDIAAVGWRPPYRMLLKTSGQKCEQDDESHKDIAPIDRYVFQDAWC